MNSKQIYHKYLETLWELMENYQLMIFSFVPYQGTYYNKELFICNKSDFEKISHEVSHHSSNRVKYAATIPVETFNDFVAYTNSENKTTIKKSISSSIGYLTNGSSKYQPNDFTTKFNTEVILNLLKKIERTDDKHIFDNLKNLFIQTGKTEKTCLSLLNSVQEQYGKEKGMELLKAFPSQVFDFSQRENLKDSIVATLNNIQKKLGKNHELIVEFVKKRASKANISQSGSIDLRDALIHFYQGESELLEDYKDFVPSLKKYLEQTEDGDFFLQKSPRIISKVIDLEEFKAVTSIKMNTNDNYAYLITLFLSTFKEKDKRILSFYSTKAWLNRKDNYISIFVSCNPNDPVPESEFDIKLKSFAKLLNKQNPKEPNDIVHLMDKWWEAEELERELNANGQKTKKTKL